MKFSMYHWKEKEIIIIKSKKGKTADPFYSL